MKPTITVEFPMEIHVPMRVLQPGQQVQFFCEGHVDEEGKLLVHHSRVVDMNKETTRFCAVEPGQESIVLFDKALSQEEIERFRELWEREKLEPLTVYDANGKPIEFSEESTSPESTSSS